MRVVFLLVLLFAAYVVALLLWPRMFLWSTLAVIALLVLAFAIYLRINPTNPIEKEFLQQAHLAEEMMQKTGIVNEMHWKKLETLAKRAGKTLAVGPSQYAHRIVLAEGNQTFDLRGNRI